MKKYAIPIVLLTVVFTLSFVMAGDFKINYGGSQIFTVATNGTMLAKNISVAGWINAAANISTSAYFVGDGRFLTNVVIADNSTKISYRNITDIPTCTAGQFLRYNATGMFCETVTIASNSVTIAGENITSGTIAEARLPSTIYTIGLNASKLAVGTIPTSVIPTLDYHNITGIPTCSAGTHLFYDGTDLTCTADSGGDYTNLAWTNESNTFSLEQNFSKYINVTQGVRLMTNDSVITRAGKETTNISIDSNGNVIINLG